VAKCSPYPRSKTLAERAAWDFMKSDAARGMELAVINPGLIVGPTLSCNDATSLGICVRLLTRQLPACPGKGSHTYRGHLTSCGADVDLAGRVGTADMSFGCVDVRDVALAHVRALEVREAAGQRFITVAKEYKMEAMAKALDAVFRPLGYNVPTGRLPYWLLWCVSWFDKVRRVPV
jgi:dihydroflavonol-4-reductase